VSEEIPRLSVPRPRKFPARPLTPLEQQTFTSIADELCGGNEVVPPPSHCPEFPEQLDLAVATRTDSFDLIVEQLANASQAIDIRRWLRTLHDEEPDAFVVVSTVAAGAYLLVPRVRHAIGYKGQYHDLPGFMEAFEELDSGILDSVIGRGDRYVPTPNERA
jgi:hypothetical protein